MRTLISLIALPALLFFSSCSAQIKNAQSTTVRIDGDCPMCEKTIEQVAYVKAEAEADWDVDAKTARITFDSTRTTLDAVLQRIAQAGYDSERYLAPDAAYAALPGCCQYVRTFKKAPVAAVPGTPAPTAAASPAQEASTDPPSQAVPDPLKPVFDAYFSTKDALVDSDADGARTKAQALAAAIVAVKMEALDHDVHMAWMKVKEPLAKSASVIAGSKDLEKQRAAFAELSVPMIDLAKTRQSGTPVYVDHCPMYNEGVDWLSQEKGIKNPYYGSMMLTCGSVKETITK